mgnify:CR=1 FL=1
MGDGAVSDDYRHDPRSYVPMSDEQLVTTLQYVESGLGVTESLRTALHGFELTGAVAKQHASRVRRWINKHGLPSSWMDPATLPRPEKQPPPSDVMPAAPGGKLHILPNTRSAYPNRKHGSNRPQQPPGGGGGEIMDDDQDGVIHGNGLAPEVVLEQPHHVVLEHLLDCQLRVLDFAMAKGDKHQATSAIGSAAKLSRELKLERAALKRAGMADRTAKGLARRMRDDEAALKSIETMLALTEGAGG